MIVEEVKEELEKLCTDYLDILQQLKNQEIISEEIFKKCSINKKSFLQDWEIIFK
nr:hypothetical protein [uncultured Romboutsia sp.]